MFYRYETHVHCSQCSACGCNTAKELVHAYRSAGYAGFVLTDHFIFGNTAVDRSLPWKQQMKCYYQPYLEAKAEAEMLDFDVIFGIEHAYGDGKEMLIYGIDLDFLLANPDIPELSIDELTDRVHEYGGVVIQAHPYRNRCYVNMAVGPREDIIDGVEVYNAGNLPNENIQALELAEKIDSISLCGGDVHAITNCAMGKTGIAFPYRVKDSHQFADALKRREHQFIIDGRIVSEITEDLLTE